MTTKVEEACERLIKSVTALELEVASSELPHDIAMSVHDQLTHTRATLRNFLNLEQTNARNKT